MSDDNVTDGSDQSSTTHVESVTDDPDQTWIAHVENGVVKARVRSEDWNKYAKDINL